MITINTLRDLAQGQPKIFGDVSKGTQYTLSITLEKDQWYTLSVQGEFEENEFIGVWLGTDKYIGCLLDNKITFKPEQNYTDVTITLKSLSGEGTIHTITLVKDIVEWPWTPAPEDYTNYDYENKECEIELGLTLPDESVEYVSIGKFTVEKAVRKNNRITLDCVDRMYKAEKDYVSDLTYPTTLGQILQSACDQAGIELATTTFANSDYIVPNEPVYEGVTCRKVFAQIAELAGGYAKINRLGQLEILTLGNESVRDITKDHYIDFRHNEVAVGKIDRVIVKVGDETAEQGTGEDIYTIVDNMFVQNPNNVVGPLYNVLKNVSYTACSLKWQGDFSLDLGDKITIDGHDTYILDRSLKYTGGLRETYRSPAKSNIEKNSTGKGSLLLDIENVKTEIKVLDGKIEQRVLKEDFNDLGERVETTESLIAQHSDEISQKVSRTEMNAAVDEAKGYADSIESGLIEQLNTQIEQTASDLTATIEQTVADAEGPIRDEMAQMQLKVNEFDLKFSTVENINSDIEDRMGQVEEKTNYLHFDGQNAELLIGGTEFETKLSLQPNKVGFKQNIGGQDELVSYWDAEQRAQFLMALLIGKFKIQNLDSHPDHLTFLYAGE